MTNIRSTRPRPTFTGYVSENLGTVSAMTAANFTAIEFSEPIAYNNTTKRISLPADMTFLVMVELGQTGGSATFEVYDVTNAAVLATSAVGADRKTVVVPIRNTTAAREIQIRLDDQTANTITAATGSIVIIPL